MYTQRVRGMKERGYKLSIEKDRVRVEHRASVRPRTIVLWFAAYLCYYLLPYVRRAILDFYRSRDPFVAGLSLLLLLIPFIFQATWFFFASGEVMSCDSRELHIARRRNFGRWRRHHFASAKIEQLRHASRGGPKTRNFTVLTFQYQGRTVDMLEDLNWTDSDRVLKACKSIGLDAVVMVDDAAAMQHDIAQRGWFINPLKPHHDDSRPTR